jgi:hypothetical protein
MVWPFHWELCKENIEKWKEKQKGKVKTKNHVRGFESKNACSKVKNPMLVALKFMGSHK